MHSLLLQTWWLPASRGAAALLFGVLAAGWPGLTPFTLGALFAGYALAVGAVCIWGAAKNRGGRGDRWMLLLLGLIGVGAGLLAVAPAAPATALHLMSLIGASALLVGLLDVATALRLPSMFRDQWWLLAAGVVSIAFGVFVLLVPGNGALTRVWLLSAYALITGLLLLALAFRIHAWARDHARALARAVASESQHQKTASLLERTERLYRVLWETTAEAICLIDNNCVIRYSNPAIQPMFGYSPEELIGRDIGLKEAESTRARNRPRFQAHFEEGHRRPEPETFEETARRKDGREFPAEVSISHVDLDGERYLAVFYRDVTDRKRAEAEQAEHTRRLQGLAQASLLVYQQESLDAIMQSAADNARNIVGAHQAVASLTIDDACTQAVKALSLSPRYARYRTFDVPPDVAGVYVAACESNRPVRITRAELEQVARRGTPGKAVRAYPRMRGWLVVPLVAKDGKNLGLIMLADKVVGDFTEDDEAIGVQLAQIASVALENLRLLEQERRLEEKYRAIFENTIEGICQTAPDGRFVVVNPAFARMLGYDAPEELLQLSPAAAHHVFVDAAARLALLRRASIAESVPKFEAELRGKNGEHVWVAGSVRAVRDDEGGIVAYEWAVEDITERKKAEQQLRYLAQYDALTGLPNRIVFADKAALALEQAKREGTLVAVLSIDLDRFKHVNDTLGHIEGDEVLRVLADRLKASIREGDTLARFGGDEFALLVQRARSHKEIEAVARNVLDAIRRPLLVSGREIFLSASIGVSVYPSDAGDVATLLKNAHIAMYRAKQEGRDTARFYAPRMAGEMPGQFNLEVQLRRAVDRDELTVHYQPRVGLVDGRIGGLEALLRWMHPTRGLLAPSKFITLAEETGLIEAIGEWVLRTVCRQQKTWARAGISPVGVAVNLSRRQLNRRQLSRDVAAIIDQAGIAPAALELEVTETAAMYDIARTLPILHELRELGTPIAIDDFGSGYSSLNYLKQVPAQYLKIDQTFVRGLPSDASDAEIVRAIIALARNLHFEVVAEGVETVDQLQFLRTEGCVQAQGHFFSRPLPPTEMEALLRRWTPSA